MRMCNWKQLFKKLNKNQEELKMNKLAKRISAVVLAGAMTLSSSIAAFAADMTVYYRTYDKDSGAVVDYGSEVVSNVDSSQTIYNALANYYGDNAGWTSAVAKDGITDYYLDSLTFGDLLEPWGTDGEYTYLEEDHSHGTWVGSSWMWLQGSDVLNNFTYPDYSLSRAYCSDENFSIILSYDTETVNW